MNPDVMNENTKKAVRYLNQINNIIECYIL